MKAYSKTFQSHNINSSHGIHGDFCTITTEGIYNAFQKVSSLPDFFLVFAFLALFFTGLKELHPFIYKVLLKCEKLEDFNLHCIANFPKLFGQSDWPKISNDDTSSYISDYKKYTATPTVTAVLNHRIQQCLSKNESSTSTEHFKPTK